MFFDSGAGAAAIIIAFASVQARQLLVQSENWYGDGTSKVYPEEFYQLCTFYAQHNGRTFRYIFALLPNKAEAAYRGLMIVISNLTKGRFPTDILIGFEHGAINTIQTL